MLLRWAQQAFRDFRAVPPGTGIVHQVNLEYLVAGRAGPRGRRRAAGLPRHPRRHRLAHHDDQRRRRARLRRRRHRGRGRPAGPAAVAAHARRSSASSSPAACGPGTTATDLVLTVTEMLRDARRGRQVRRALRRTGSRSLTLADRATIANMSPEFGATGTHVPDRRRDAPLHEHHRPPGRGDRADRGLRQGAGPVPHRRRPGPRVRRDARARPRRRSCRASPARAARRTGSPSAPSAGEFRENFTEGLVANGAGPHYEPVDVTVDGDTLPAADRLGRDRRHHQLHQHLQPVGDGRAPACWPRRPSSGPDARRPGSRPASPPAAGP